MRKWLTKLPIKNRLLGTIFFLAVVIGAYTISSGLVAPHFKQTRAKATSSAVGVLGDTTKKPAIRAETSPDIHADPAVNPSDKALTPEQVKPTESAGATSAVPQTPCAIITAAESVAKVAEDELHNKKILTLSPVSSTAKSLLSRDNDSIKIENQRHLDALNAIVKDFTGQLAAANCN